MLKYLLYSICTIAICFSCIKTKDNSIIIGIQPFENIQHEVLDTIRSSLEHTYGFPVYMLEPIPIPENAFVNIKSPRYRADTLIRHLKSIKNDSIDYILGVIDQDISTTKRGKDGSVKKPESRYTDWGIFGLGYRPGPSCIVSLWRIKKNQTKYIDRLTKISIHEIGHNMGLPHCTSSPDCVMRDAAETIQTVDKVKPALCKECWNKIH